MKPVNDTVLVEVDNKKFGKYSQGEEKSQTGKIVAVSDKILYLSSFSWVLENSLKHEGQLEEIRQYYESLIGKTVRWEELADRGTSFDKDGKKYALIKITKILGVE